MPALANLPVGGCLRLHLSQSLTVALPLLVCGFHLGSGFHLCLQLCHFTFQGIPTLLTTSYPAANGCQIVTPGLQLGGLLLPAGVLHPDLV